MGVELGPRILPELNLEDGKVVLLGAHGIPPHSETDSLEWSVAYLDVLDKQSSAAALLQLINTVQAEIGPVTLFAEDCARRATDPRALELLAMPNPPVVINETLFHVLGAQALGDWDHLMEALNLARSYVLNVFILPQLVAPKFENWANEGDMKQLKLGLTGTIHEAYDREGYVAWLNISPGHRDDGR